MEAPASVLVFALTYFILGLDLAFCAVLAALEPLGGAVYRITPEEMARTIVD